MNHCLQTAALTGNLSCHPSLSCKATAFVLKGHYLDQLSAMIFGSPDLPQQVSEPLGLQNFALTLTLLCQMQQSGPIIH